MNTDLLQLFEMKYWHIIPQFFIYICILNKENKPLLIFIIDLDTSVKLLQYQYLLHNSFMNKSVGVYFTLKNFGAEIIKYPKIILTSDRKSSTFYF